MLNKLIVSSLVAAGLSVAALPAQAHGNWGLNVGIAVPLPGIAIGPAYAPPAYYPPAPAYYGPQPGYYAPAYYRPAPVYGYGYGYRYGWDHRGWDHRGWDHRGGDGRR